MTYSEALKVTREFISNGGKVNADGTVGGYTTDELVAYGEACKVLKVK